MSEPSRVALEAAHAAVLSGGDVERALVRAAEALASDPWAVVHGAGALARASWDVLEQDTGVDARLRAVPPDDPRAVVVFPRGSRAPVEDTGRRRRAGAFDTPPALARRVVAAGRAAATGTVQRGLDPTCGPGAFLVAMAEAGVPEIHGVDLDPWALVVARVAVPGAVLTQADALDGGEPVDLVVGNPPFVSSERLGAARRRALRAQRPWLSGRFDLAVPVADAAVSRVRTGGGVALVLPASLLVEPYAAGLRQRWLHGHRITTLGAPDDFPGVASKIAVVALRVGEGPAPLPSGVPSEELLALPTSPLDAARRPSDRDLVGRVRSRSRALGELARVDTGVVAHGPLGGKARLLCDAPEPGTVPYADARDFFSGRRRWLRYRPDEMHRAKDPSLFEAPKLVVQRIKGRRPVRVAVDRDGVYVGHTCTVVVPHAADAPLERWAELVADPRLAGVLRLERGPRLDLYPRDVAAIPVPLAWDHDPTLPLAEAWGLDATDADRLLTLGRG